MAGAVLVLCSASNDMQGSYGMLAVAASRVSLKKTRGAWHAEESIKRGLCTV